MRVLVTPDSFGGTLSAPDAAAAIAAGWRAARPDDEVVELPLSDGGEGLLDVLGGLPGAVRHEREVVDPRGLARVASWLVLADGTAVVETAQACGLAHLAEDRRDPRLTTTWGAGQLLDEARRAGAHRMLVGLGGSATVDGGAGALSGLGHALTVEDGSGLKIGGEDLPRVRGAARTWVGDWDGIEVLLLADVRTVLADAPARFGPQKGADEATVAHLEQGLTALREVCERDLGALSSLATLPGSGAAGGLGYGLAAALPGGVLTPGAEAVADLVGLGAALRRADLVVTGEGRLDASSGRGKVPGLVAARAGVPVLAVVGEVAERGAVPLADVEAAGTQGGARAAVTAAATRLAGRTSPRA